MTEVGHRLKEERERRGLSISDIAQVTKIQEKYLVALEEGSYTVFPSQGHALAFLHKYCSLLELPEKQLVALFKSEMYPVAASVKPKDAFVHPSQQKGIIITTKQAVVTSVLLFILLIIFYTFLQLHTLLIAPPLVVFSPESGATISDFFVIVEGRTASDAQMRINDRMVEVAEDGYFKEKIELSNERSQTIILKSSNKISKASTEVRRTVKMNRDLQVQQDVSSMNNPTMVTLRVRVTEDTVVTVDIDEKSTGELLPKDTIKTYTATKKITFYSIKSQATYLSFQGGPEEQMGTGGRATRTWSLTP
jgi:cytoskeletal protein RodZ